MMRMNRKIHTRTQAMKMRRSQGERLECGNEVNAYYNDNNNNESVNNRIKRMKRKKIWSKVKCRFSHRGKYYFSLYIHKFCV